MIIRGGENIAPAAVERALMAIPGVNEAVVFGVPHRRPRRGSDGGRGGRGRPDVAAAQGTAEGPGRLVRDPEPLANPARSRCRPTTPARSTSPRSARRCAPSCRARASEGRLTMEQDEFVPARHAAAAAVSRPRQPRLARQGAGAPGQQARGGLLRPLGARARCWMRCGPGMGDRCAGVFEGVVAHSPMASGEAGGAGAEAARRRCGRRPGRRLVDRHGARREHPGRRRRRRARALHACRTARAGCKSPQLASAEAAAAHRSDDADDGDGQGRQRGFRSRHRRTPRAVRPEDARAGDLHRSR